MATVHIWDKTKSLRSFDADLLGFSDTGSKQSFCFVLKLFEYVLSWPFLYVASLVACPCVALLFRRPVNEVNGCERIICPNGAIARIYGSAQILWPITGPVWRPFHSLYQPFVRLLHSQPMSWIFTSNRNLCFWMAVSVITVMTHNHHIGGTNTMARWLYVVVVVRVV